MSGGQSRTAASGVAGARLTQDAGVKAHRRVGRTPDAVAIDQGVGLFDHLVESDVDREGRPGRHCDPKSVAVRRLPVAGVAPGGAGP
jgi:hypothetical protein